MVKRVYLKLTWKDVVYPLMQHTLFTCREMENGNPMLADAFDRLFNFGGAAAVAPKSVQPPKA
jgi:hypothetical protein